MTQQIELFYAVAGSRTLTPDCSFAVRMACRVIRSVFIEEHAHGKAVWYQRNGMGEGADTLFFNNAVIGNNYAVYAPHSPYKGHDVVAFDASKINASNQWQAIGDICEECHPNWTMGQRYAPLFYRTVTMLLGNNLDEPVEFLVTAENPLSTTGGTRFTKAVAKKYRIPQYDVISNTDNVEFETWLKGQVARSAKKTRM